MSTEFPNYCCPQCKGSLNFAEQAYNCPACRRSYPVVLGIPDFRVFPDPYISYEEDYSKARFLVENSEGLDFEGMMRLYWQITPQVERERAERFIRSARALVDKGDAKLKEIETLGGGCVKPGPRTLLEVGCGTGGFLIAAKNRFEHVVGIDIAFRWLVIARKRLAEAGLDCPLVCGCAEHLPFKETRFDLVVAESVLEHVKQQEAMLNECYRVLNDNGALFLATTNRFSLTPEPHVRVWGVGFLPRRLMKPYVRLVKGIPYEYIRILSLFELKAMLRKCSFPNHRITLPSVPADEVKDFSDFEKLEVKVYDVIRKTPVLRELLYLFGPFFHVLCTVRKTGGGAPAPHAETSGVSRHADRR